MLEWMTKDNTAVVTGGANGIGLSTAKKLAASNMNVVILDLNTESLDAAKESLQALGSGDVLTIQCDVSNFADMQKTCGLVFDTYGSVECLMNNAGAALPRHKPWKGLEDWKRQLDINLWGIIHGCQTFLAKMIESGKPGTVINTGSKQGITNPPGGYAYNLSKAGVISYTQSLAHEIRTDDLPINVHLLVPGFTYSEMIARFIPEKPPGAWTCEEVTDYLIEGIVNNEFYLICPDHDTPPELDAKRMRWNTEDLIEKRPALSRWHPDFASAYEAFIQQD